MDSLSRASRESDVYESDFDTILGPAVDQSEDEDQDHSPYHSNTHGAPSGSSSSSTDPHERLTRDVQSYNRLMRILPTIP